MVARDVAKGKAALNKILEKKDFHLMNLQFHQLDVTDTQSIEKLRKFLLSRYNGLDLLINNAGIHYPVSAVCLYVSRGLGLHNLCVTG